MWLTISLINHSLFHAYITGTLFVIIKYFLGVERNIFALMVLIAAVIAEYREHIRKIHTYPGDWFSAVRDSGIMLLILLFLFVLSRFSNDLSLQKKYIFLSGSIIFVHGLFFFLDGFFRPNRPIKTIHWEPKHVFDIVSNFLGPFLFSPILYKLLSLE